MLRQAQHASPQGERPVAKPLEPVRAEEARFLRRLEA